MTLRRRLLIGLLLLTTVALAVGDLATWFELRSYLQGQVTAQLTNIPNVIQTATPQGGLALDTMLSELPSGSWYELVGPGGVFQQSGGSSPPAVPTVPDSLQPPSGTSFNQPFTVSAVNDSRLHYRAIAVAVHISGFGPATLIVAIPLSGVDSTLSRLALIELLVTIGALAGLAAAGLAIIRLGLRPLEAMTETAGAISKGDLSRRVPTEDERTEVGRLGTALNSMLAQIESAFEAKERSESRLRRFVADASHELRTPLTSIRGYAELFRRGAAQRPDDLAKAMRRIEEEATRMGVLVEELLTLARLDVAATEARSPLDGIVDLQALAADAVDDLRAVDSSHPVDLVGARVLVAGDEAALRQVVANLLNNAVHHTPPGTPIHLRISVAPDRPAGVIEVQDEGPGMTAEEASHAFERFWRADPARTRGHGGAGLGLSIVAGILAAHGGEVSLVTAPSEGAQFRVVLPLAEMAKVTDLDEGAAQGTPPTEVSGNGRGSSGSGDSRRSGDSAGSGDSAESDGGVSGQLEPDGVSVFRTET